MCQAIKDIWNINWGMGENNTGRPLFGAHSAFLKESLKCVLIFLKRNSIEFEIFVKVRKSLNTKQLIMQRNCNKIVYARSHRA